MGAGRDRRHPGRVRHHRTQATGHTHIQPDGSGRSAFRRATLPEQRPRKAPRIARVRSEKPEPDTATLPDSGLDGHPRATLRNDRGSGGYRSHFRDHLFGMPGAGGRRRPPSHAASLSRCSGASRRRPALSTCAACSPRDDRSGTATLAPASHTRPCRRSLAVMCSAVMASLLPPFERLVNRK
jgi:hypothetical protein